MNIAPALLSVQYSIIDSWCATIALRAHCEQDQKITVIHDTQTGVRDYDLAGDGSLPVLSVGDRDALFILVRNDDQILACGLYEIQIGISEVLGAILVPITISNILLDQCDEEIITSGETRHIEMEAVL